MKMKITADLTKGKLIIGDAMFPISNNIRTIREGTRKSYEVIRTIPDDLPYDPCHFPKGLWEITGIEWQKEKGFDPNTYGPVKIRTNAKQRVKIWELDDEGDYLRESKNEVTDHGYLLHYSTSGTTLGCIRIASPKDAEKIAGIIHIFLEQKDVVQLEVI